MVIRILAAPDSLLLHELDAVFRAVLGGDNIGFLFQKGAHPYRETAKTPIRSVAGRHNSVLTTHMCGATPALSLSTASKNTKEFACGAPEITRPSPFSSRATQFPARLARPRPFLPRSGPRKIAIGVRLKVGGGVGWEDASNTI